jgi:hypothetical protein
VTNREIKHKGIVLKDRDGRYWILYVQFRYSTVSVDDLPAISEVSGQSVLSYRTRVPGTGNFFIELHFVYDHLLNTPMRIDTSSIDKAIERAVPEGHWVAKGGGLDLGRMKYSSDVWKPGDGNASATGGKIDLGLSLDKGILRVREVKYTREDESRR